MNGIVLELVSHVVSISTSVDSKKVRVGIINHDTSYKSADTSEAIDSESVTAHLKGGRALGSLAQRAEGYFCIRIGDGYGRKLLIIFNYKLYLLMKIRN